MSSGIWWQFCLSLNVLNLTTRSPSSCEFQCWWEDSIILKPAPGHQLFLQVEGSPQQRSGEPSVEETGAQHHSEYKSQNVLQERDDVENIDSLDSHSGDVAEDIPPVVQDAVPSTSRRQSHESDKENWEPQESPLKVGAKEKEGEGLDGKEEEEKEEQELVTSR